MSFIHEDFLLSNKTARRLYHAFAEDQPILDYHCHLPPQDVAANRQFQNLFEIWLEGDHYKWRAMRANGVPESHCTGNAPVYEKFEAWARTVPATLRNPLYHWTHLELKRYFGIDELLDAGSAARVWEQANAKLATPELSAHGILAKFQVKAVCTTDDPTDDLAAHAAIAASEVGDQGIPDLPPRQGAERARSGAVQSLGGPAAGGGEQAYRDAGGFRGRAPAAPRFLPRDGRAAERSRAQSRVPRFSERARSGEDLRTGAGGPRGQQRRARQIRRVI